MNKTVIGIAGTVPAVIIPTATVIQLYQVASAPDAEGVSWLTWFLFGVANVGFYVYTEKYRSLPSILGFLGTAVLDFVIVAVVLAR